MKNGYIFTKNGKMYVLVGSCIEGKSGNRLLLCQEMYEGGSLVAWPGEMIPGFSAREDDKQESAAYSINPNVHAATDGLQKQNAAAELCSTGLDENADKNKLQDDSVHVMMNESPDSGILEAKLEAFFDADTASEKLELLRSMKNEITESVLSSMAIYLDFELSPGDLDEKYYSLERYLRTRVHFEGRRPH